MLRMTRELVVRMVLRFDSGFIDGFHNESPLEGISYDSILVIVGLHNQPVQINVPGLAEIISDVVIGYHDLQGSATETQSSPPSFGSLVLLSNSTVVTTYASLAKISIPNQITLRPSYVWQIPFRRTFEVTCKDLAIIRKVC